MSEIIFYMIHKNNKIENIYAVTKETKKYLFGTIVYSSNEEIINNSFKISKNSVSDHINEYDFTKSLEL